MKRFLAILLALMIPMQSAWSAIGPIASRFHAGCAQTVSTATHQDHSGMQAANVSDCDCGALPHTGVHTFVHHHGCVHFGVAMLTAATADASPPAPAGAAPDSKHASFESVVLDVPSPPPTTGA
jgi:hypothetical protein